MKVMVVSIGGLCGQGGEAGISEAGRPGEERWCGAGLSCLWLSVPGRELVNWPLVAQAQVRRMAVRHSAGSRTSPRPRMLRNNRISCIHNDSFTGLRNVRLLSLYDNQIATISPGAFDTLQALSTL